MNDIYELLNDVEIDENEIEMMEVSELEKEKVKKSLKKSIKKNNVWKKKSLVAAALCCAIIGSVGVVGVVRITNPAYAAEIPIVGDIFRLLDNGKTGVYDKYKENANEINVTKESNGVAITIKDAIFDGKTVSYTYEIKSDKDLGEMPRAVDLEAFSIKEYKGGTNTNFDIKKVANNTYIGQDNITIDEDKNKITCKLNIRGIEDISPDNKGIVIDGNWDFDFNLKAIESKKQIIDKGREKDGAKINIEDISKTSMSFSIDYTQTVTKELEDKWFGIGSDIEVKDDLGNIYTGGYNTSCGNGDDYISFRKNFGKLNENATKLILTPKMDLINSGGGTSIDENGKETELKPTVDAEHQERGEIIFDDIVVDLEK